MKLIVWRHRHGAEPGSSGLFFWLITVVLLIGDCAGLANPAVYPKRRVNNYTVDLMPLILWWEEPHGNRPLLSWKHIQGTLEQESGFLWLIQAKAEGQTGWQALALKNPPRERLQRYRELKELLPKLEQARASAAQIANLPAYSGWHWNYYGLARTPSADYDRIEQAKAHVQELDHRIGLAHEELAVLADKHANFRIDAFALRVNEIYQGRPGYDFGYPP